jgi:hypothetical protein
MSASSNKYPTGNKSRSAVQKQWELTWKTNRKKRGCEDAWHKLRMIMVICKNVVRDKLICDKLHSIVTCVCVGMCCVRNPLSNHWRVQYSGWSTVLRQRHADPGGPPQPANCNGHARHARQQRHTDQGSAPQPTFATTRPATHKFLDCVKAPRLPLASKVPQLLFDHVASVRELCVTMLYVIHVVCVKALCVIELCATELCVTMSRVTDVACNLKKCS